MDKYDTSHKKRGLAIIFNHQYYDRKLNLEIRKGTMEDEKNLIQILKQLGFHVIVFMDSTKETIIKSIQYYSQPEHHIDADCVMVIVLTHGDTGGVINARDDKLTLDQLWEPFKSCDSLKGKPKIFIVQACRGEKVCDMLSLDSEVEADGKGQMPSGSNTPSLEDNSVRSLLPHPNPDFLVAYSTVEECKSWRHKALGTWYVSMLCEELTNCQNNNILTVLTKVNRAVALKFADEKRPQAPCFSSSLRRSFFLEEKSGGRFCNECDFNPSLASVNACQLCKV